METGDLERNFTICIAYRRPPALVRESKIQSAVAADVRKANRHGQLSKRTSRRIQETTALTPSPAFRLVKTKGLSFRINRASRSITDKSAPTWGARSVLL